jgi:hypothetical protein
MHPYHIRNGYSKFVSTFNRVTSVLNNKPTDSLHRAILFTGAINQIWQTWNNFWRIFWLSHLRGGKNIDNSNIAAHATFATEELALGFLINTSSGSSLPPYREKTWGDKNIISFVAGNLYALDGNPSPTIPISITSLKILNAIGILGNSIEDMQTVRNSSVHLNYNSINNISTIIPSYVISKIKHPTDILFSKTTYDNKIALRSWQDEMFSLLELIFE